MTFDDYQKAAYAFARYPRTVEVEYFEHDDPLADSPYVDVCQMAWTYPAMALAEEAGEVSGKFAKFLRKRDFSNKAFETLRSDVAKELGDVLWQVAAVATELWLDLQDIADANLAKLEGRAAAGTIIGEGDDR